MAEPQRLPTDDICDGGAPRPTTEPGPAPAGVETPRPPVGDTRHGDATHPTGEPHPAPADVEPSLLRRTLLQSDVDIPVDRVSVVGSRRALQEDKVIDIAKSIERHGVVSPILVRIWEDASQPPAAEVAIGALLCGA